MRLYLLATAILVAIITGGHKKNAGVVAQAQEGADTNGTTTTTTLLALKAANVHWGYFSKNLTPVLTCPSGTTVVVEMATHHACDDWDAMISGDAGLEDIYTWNSINGANEPYRGATGKGDGVHILTGPIYVEGAEPGDILKVEILNLRPRVNPTNGKTFGSNAAAWWGYHARVPKLDGTKFTAGSFSGTPTQNDELVTIYEVRDDGQGQGFAVPVYQFEWPVITDPVRTLVVCIYLLGSPLLLLTCQLRNCCFC
jgi:Acetamidase/Formamidase family